ncbi:MAG: YHS domain-containing (seleno)protein [Gammaproteobacteria bacterium]
MRKILTAFLWLLAAAPLAAADEKFVWYPYDGGLGADGYDVVAYFDGGGAVRGDARFTAEYDGQSWRFTDAARRDAFLAAPEKYAPQYGGYCAYAASLNAQAFGDPEVWTVHNGKLYFNYNKPTRARWEIGVNGRITKSDIYWRDEVLAEARAEDGE